MDAKSAVEKVEQGELSFKPRREIGTGLISRSGEIIRKVLPGRRCAIVTDTNVASLFAESLKKSLVASGFDPTVILLPSGERSKTLEQTGAICERMVAAHLDRQSFVIGLGGGVVGDISGFVAAIFQRGIPHVQIPTTLLAMVDSSVGGKTGVNTRTGKNMLGAMHQPALIIDDIDLLKTLPRRELNQGFVEVIKHAIIADAEMFVRLKDFPIADTSALQKLVKRNIDIKMRIIAQDEMDRAGRRALLNFGHTVGHAIERAGDYDKLLHGEAISLGMIAACHVSMMRAGLSQAERDAIADLLNTFNLPLQLPPDIPRDKILEVVPFDKKFAGGKVRFVVTPRIGSAVLSSDVTLDDIREAIERL